MIKVIAIMLAVMMLMGFQAPAGGGKTATAPRVTACGIGEPAYHEPDCGIGEPAYHEPAGSIGEAATHEPR